MNKNLRITVRFEESERQKIDSVIEAEKFKSISDVVRAALTEFLKK